MRAIIDKYAGLPFRYGDDCCQFAGEVVEYFTGENPMDALSYSDERSAMKIIEQYGDLEQAMRHFLGDPYTGHKDGDVCLIDTNDGDDAAAVIYRGQVVARVKGGLMNYPLSRAKLIWCT